MTKMIEDLFGLQNQVAAITGGSGVLGSAMAKGLAQAGARVAILDIRAEACEQLAAEIRAEGGAAIGVVADLLNKEDINAAADRITAELGPVSILVNAVGGNRPSATTSAEHPWYAIEDSAIDSVFRLNFTGVLFGSQVFGRVMAERKEGCIINIASMNALRPLTHIPVYSAAKAAVANFTQWLAVEVARESSPNIRVNAIAPGFFLTEQNRFLLTDPQTGGWTARGKTILEHTPMGRMGVPDDLVGTLLWLASPAAKFVTGIVVPVDGGFSAYSGV
jgi:NAD(P)-dependent dehydrogenase (short-subunit alcohol dehydrogenase family)